jgi:hypothetical protein
LLSAFAKVFVGGDALPVFRATVVCMGAMGALAAAIFAQVDERSP